MKLSITISQISITGIMVINFINGIMICVEKTEVRMK